MPCMVLQAEPWRSATLRLRTGRPDTMWLEVFRITENMQTYPDFLANHNSGTLKVSAHAKNTFASRIVPFSASNA